MKLKITMIAAAIALAGAVSPFEATAETEFNASSWLPPAHPLTKYGYIEWVERLKEASGGSLLPKLFVGSALLPPGSHLSGVRDGIAQVAWHAGSYTPSDLPEDNVLYHIAFIYSDYFVGAFATTEINMTDPEFLAQWKRNGIVYGGGYSTPPYRLICETKISTLSEIKGKKLRTAGGAISDWAKSVGAVPVNVKSSETYSGLEKGQLDCATQAIDDLKSRSYWDVAKHVTMVDLGVYWSGYQYGINRDFWVGLSVDDRRVFFDTMAKAIVNTGVEYLRVAEDVVKEAKGKGVTFYEPSPDLQDSINNFKDEVRKTAVTIGKDKYNLKNPQGFLNRFEAIVQKWQKLLKGVDRKDRKALLALLNREVYDKIDPAIYGTN